MSNCILYHGKPRPDGYVQVRVNRKFKYVHVLAWIESHGEVPDGMLGCHTCDTRNCINPDHLFLGTTKDNMNDKVFKCRQSKGESHGMSKLTFEIVKETKSRSWIGNGIQSDDINCYEEWEEDIVVYDQIKLKKFIEQKLSLHQKEIHERR